MERKILIIILLGFSLFNQNVAQTYSHENKHPKVSIIERSEKLNTNKKDLKRELKRRKKFHKSLLSLYNKGFEEKYLKIIENNSFKISELRNNVTKI